MGGRGANFRSGSGGDSVKALQKEYDRLGERMATLQREHGAEWYASGGMSASRQEYYKTKAQRDAIRKKLNAAQAKEQAKAVKAQSTENDAPIKQERYITTLSYERWQRRLEKEILSFMGYHE